jgi:alkaline phosphatase
MNFVNCDQNSGIVMKSYLLCGTIVGLAGVCTVLPSLAHAEPIKNVIVMISDGAGYNTQQAVRYFTGAPLLMDGPGWTGVAQSTYPLRTSTTPGSTLQDPNTVYDPAKAYDTTPVPGNSAVPGFTTYPAGFKGYEFGRATYPDSANTMSSMMTGVKTYNNAVNVDGAGNPVYSLAQAMHDAGKSAGVVTTVQFSDATPAAGGGAHNIARANHAAIANEMFSAGTLSVIAGTGNPDFNNDGQPMAADYNWMPQPLWSDLKTGSNTSGSNAQNWKLVQDRSTIQALANGTQTSAGPLAIIAQAFDGTQEYRSDPSGTDIATYLPGQTPKLTNTPTLSELELAALNKLGANPSGLFLMVEGGAVDRAMHSNNFGRMIEEYQEFQTAVGDVINWVNRADTDADWNNTLLIVTSDHDHNLYGPDGATIPFEGIVDNGPGNLPGYRWFGSSHSNNLIPLYAYGAGSTGIVTPGGSDRRLHRRPRPQLRPRRLHGPGRTWKVPACHASTRVEQPDFVGVRSGRHLVAAFPQAQARLPRLKIGPGPERTFHSYD